jgi:DNA-binding beta-propeller fold protein YncE
VDTANGSNVLVADPCNDRVEIFDVNGNFLRNIVGSGAGALVSPIGVALDTANRSVLVADGTANSVQVYTNPFTASVPALGAWCMLALALLLGSAGYFAMRSEKGV